MEESPLGSNASSTALNKSNLEAGGGGGGAGCRFLSVPGAGNLSCFSYFNFSLLYSAHPEKNLTMDSL